MFSTICRIGEAPSKVMLLMKIKWAVKVRKAIKILVVRFVNPG